MKAKIGVIFLVAVIASAGMGVSYAGTNSRININGVCCPDVEFTDVTTSDNEYEKEVADVTAQIINDGSGIYVGISNAYPEYIATINFTMENVGSKPIYVSAFSIESSDDDALDIDVIPDINVGTWLCNHGDKIIRDLTVRITQLAEQNTPYSFWVNTTFKDE